MLYQKKVYLCKKNNNIKKYSNSKFNLKFLKP